MPVRPRPVAVLALALGALLLLAGCGGSGDTQATPASPTAAPGRTLTVVATTNVWGIGGERVAGPGVEVRSIIQDPAADPHSYESTPADAAAISRAPTSSSTTAAATTSSSSQLLDGDPAAPGARGRGLRAARRPARGERARLVRPDRGQGRRHPGRRPPRRPSSPPRRDALRQRATAFSGASTRRRRGSRRSARRRPARAWSPPSRSRTTCSPPPGVADATPPGVQPRPSRTRPTRRPRRSPRPTSSSAPAGQRAGLQPADRDPAHHRPARTRRRARVCRSST